MWTTAGLLLLPFAVGILGVADEPTTDEQAAVEALWKMHCATVQHYIGWPGGDAPIDQKKFADAVEFLERASGILSNTGTTLGRLPVDGLDATLAQWKSWFKANKKELCIDSSSCLVVMCESLGSRQR